MSKISTILAKKIFDSRKEATIEVTITTDDGISAVASVPSGRSVGTHEALAIDADQAVQKVNEVIQPKIIGMDPTDQEGIDNLMMELDGTGNKSNLGANAILGVSIAATKAGALSQKMPLYQYIAELALNRAQLFVPSPMFNILNGGKHTKTKLPFQEFMIMPTGFDKFSEKFEAGKKIFYKLGDVIKNRGLDITVGDEGGFAPAIESNEKALDLIMEAVKGCGYEAGKNVVMGLDVAASSLPGNFPVSPQMYIDLVSKYPIGSLEDPMAEDEWHMWSELIIELSNNNKDILVIGDDIFATNASRLRRGIEGNVASGAIVKPNQAGTVTEVLKFVETAITHDYQMIVSHRSGETLDDFIADLAVGIGARYLKSGAPNTQAPERMAKYNRLLAIEKDLEG